MSHSAEERRRLARIVEEDAKWEINATHKADYLTIATILREPASPTEPDRCVGCGHPRHGRVCLARFCECVEDNTRSPSTEPPARLEMKDSKVASVHGMEPSNSMGVRELCGNERSSSSTSLATSSLTSSTKKASTPPAGDPSRREPTPKISSPTDRPQQNDAPASPSRSAYPQTSPSSEARSARSSREHHPDSNGIRERAQALVDALERASADICGWMRFAAELDALRAALAQPTSEGAFVGGNGEPKV